MKILGIDTSSKFLSIALSEGNKIIIEESFLLDRMHSSLLVPKIKQMLERANLSIGGVDAFVIGLGPGSFTGLRIGVSAVKGFGIATGKPCIGVPSIDAVSLNIGEETGFSSIIPIIDAKRGQVYSAIYAKKAGRIARKSGYILTDAANLMKRIKGRPVFLGDGIELYREKITHLNQKAVFLDESYWYPRAGNLIRLALNALRARRRFELALLEPIYLYARDCQIRKRKV